MVLRTKLSLVVVVMLAPLRPEVRVLKAVVSSVIRIGARTAWGVVRRRPFRVVPGG